LQSIALASAGSLNSLNILVPANHLLSLQSEDAKIKTKVKTKTKGGKARLLARAVLLPAR
jgi:hypothetical protein